jgi:2C-methyl-D-erythritol 2,4-cyclodiphosphate synthase
MNNTIQSSKSAHDFQDGISELNSKILAITMTITNDFPELSKYLEEMPETIPNNLKPEITLLNLTTYHETLDTLLKNYILAHSDG